MPRATLLSFVSFRDPYYRESHDDGRLKGPVLTVIDERKFDRVVLFSRPHRREEVERTRAALRETHPKLKVEVVDTEIGDSTYHPRIVAALRRILTRLRHDAPEDDYVVSLLAGTPEIHASWVLLAASGEFPARLLNLRRTVHEGLAGPRVLRELDWSEPLAAIKPETLSLLSARRDRWDDAELQGTVANIPRHYFGRRSIEQAVQLGRHVTPLLITGEPGTQKQHMAALVHELGPRRAGPLVIFNCATVPENLFESVLFGDDVEDTPGKLRQADGGTLVLIKIQYVPGAVLARLVKAVDDGYLYRTGTSVPIKARVRLIATSDRDLEVEVRRGRFPAEIWRRLQSSMVRLPPLRERPGDIPLLARDELERLNRTLPRARRFSAGALAKLESHAWPSNISELRRVIEHAVVNAEGPVIEPGHIDLDLSVSLSNVFAQAAPRIREGFSLEAYLRTIKHELVRAVLRKTRGNQSQAARLLGVTPQAVSKMLKEMR
jgi:DNA-binding NtrC family response regulator